MSEDFTEDFTQSNLLDSAVVDMVQFMCDPIYVAPIPGPGMDPIAILIQRGVTDAACRS